MNDSTRAGQARALGVSRSTLYRMERSGAIPAAQRISGNRSVFSPQAQRVLRNVVGVR